ncbi:MAG: glycosidase, partial [Armatimonadetes bacterium]|nr:glycosidase [Armatimonadota bacterium]
SRRSLLHAGAAWVTAPLFQPALAARTLKPLLGVYCGNDPDEVQQFERWLGCKVEGVLGYTGGADWADFDGSVPWAVQLWSKLDRPILWSVPLIPKGASLESAAKGDYNDHYRKAAGHLARFRPEDRKLYLRTGWEFNGDWMPWSAHGKPKAFAGAFRQFVQTFRSVSPRFAVEWNVNIGDTGMNPETAYPGDDVVDLIGMDFYWQIKWDPKDPEEAWKHALNRPYGLKWHQAFAKQHRKPTAYSEWGIQSNNAAPYLGKVKEWFDTHPVLYQTYWNSNADYPGKLSEGQYPRAGSAYRKLFGRR